MQPNRHADLTSPLLASGPILAAFVLVLLFASNMASAQISGNVSAVSDYRYRGMSLSQGKPEAQLSVGYDHPDGWYAGGMLTGVELYGINSAQLISYAGYAGKLDSRVSWEGGVSHSTFNHLTDFSYTETYLGLTSQNVNARVYYSPSYFDQYTRSVYGELNANYPLQDNIQLLVHGGELHQIDSGGSNDATSRFDYRFGVSSRFGDWNCQLALVGLQKKSTSYPQYQDTHLRSLVFSVGYSF